MIGERHVFADAEGAARAGAELFVALAGAAIARNDRFTVALAGGSTPRRMYQLLAGEPFRSAIAWTRVEFFWSDERGVPPEHADSNFRMSYEAMLAPLAIPPGRIHRMPGERDDLDAGAHDYQSEIAQVLGGSIDDPPPSFDLILLGMGADGHTASLFPGSPALQETQRWVVSAPGPGAKGQRMTFTLPLIDQAEVVALLIAGVDKAQAMARVMTAAAPPLPVQRVNPRGKLIWLLDRAAAGSPS